ncbi:hypothetical protein [Paraburkholderia fynbosensis]|uniref:hypothetical protein n=1 Tax=Paraburkholderia fynbosensis TaxID=1200993 RepID=UPI00158193DD|nr:hypothetical protein [Paraburkholderia fynbosensis]
MAVKASLDYGAAAAIRSSLFLSQNSQQTIPEAAITLSGSQNYNVITDYEQERSQQDKIRTGGSSL